jgi:hypothetical protein
MFTLPFEPTAEAETGALPFCRLAAVEAAETGVELGTSIVRSSCEDGDLTSAAGASEGGTGGKAVLGDVESWEGGEEVALGVESWAEESLVVCLVTASG